MNFELAIEDHAQADELLSAVMVARRIYADADMGTDVFEPLLATLGEARSVLGFCPRVEHATSPDPAAERIAALSRSPWFDFWSGLSEGQQVRWIRHPSATYTVATGERVIIPPDANRRRRGDYVPVDDPSNSGMWIELIRKSGKHFWCHITQVRPFAWKPE